MTVPMEDKRSSTHDQNHLTARILDRRENDLPGPRYTRLTCKEDGVTEVMSSPSHGMAARLTPHPKFSRDYLHL